MTKPRRSPSNPIIQPQNVNASNPNMEVIGVFNAGVTRYLDETILLLRVAERPINDNPEVYVVPLYHPSEDRIVLQEIERKPEYDFSDVRVIRTPERNYLTSMSHLRIARSTDGIHFTIESEPTLLPSGPYESYGIEDPRITLIDNIYYITYSAISELGICTSMITTEDFITFTRQGNIFHPDNKDVAIFPASIGGSYYALHRPSCSHYGQPEMWIAESGDLKQWGNHRHLIGVRPGFWDDGRIGASAVPFEIEEGWLEIYHGADKSNRYCIGALLLDKHEPWKVIARSVEPIMEPETDYELEGFFGNVIFPCGALHEEGLAKIYYGASDTSIGYAEVTIEAIRANLGLKQLNNQL
ncbi:glycoside hydrolase family 130 protein [Paenibacillus lignilyticus]|nr:glycoside hydrolase family 130 protein [Paenibacillus lignilyticus]